MRTAVLRASRSCCSCNASGDPGIAFFLALLEFLDGSPRAEKDSAFSAPPAGLEGSLLAMIGWDRSTYSWVQQVKNKVAELQCPPFSQS